MRAKENTSVAEMELMSSTSDEVCELWNGKDVVRCPGKAPILEFICLLPENMASFKKEGKFPTLKTMTLNYGPGARTSMPKTFVAGRRCITPANTNRARIPLALAWVKGGIG